MDTNETPTTSTTRNVFITDATGTTGREVTRQLSRAGARVAGLTQGLDGAAIVRRYGGIPAFCDPFRAGELRSVMQGIEADVAIHLTPQSVNHVPMPGTDWDANTLVRGTEALLEAAREKGLKFLVYTSYAFVYGENYGEWVDENAPLLDPGDNAFLKAAIEAEQMVLHSGVPACILRAGYVYGAGDAAFREALREGRPLVVNEEENYANWIYAGDLANAAILAAQQQPTGEIFNIVDDQPVSLAHFIDDFAAAFGVTQAVRVPSLRLPAFAARALTSDMQRFLWDISLRVRNEKAKERLGWTLHCPTHREGIEQTLLAWRAEEAAQT